MLLVTQFTTSISRITDIKNKYNFTNDDIAPDDLVPSAITTQYEKAFQSKADAPLSKLDKVGQVHGKVRSPHG